MVQRIGELYGEAVELCDDPGADRRRGRQGHHLQTTGKHIKSLGIRCIIELSVIYKPKLGFILNVWKFRLILFNQVKIVTN